MNQLTGLYKKKEQWQYNNNSDVTNKKVYNPDVTNKKSLKKFIIQM
jgi:hypothetical protein